MRLAHLAVVVGVFTSAATLAAQLPQGSGPSERKLPAPVVSPSDQSAAGNDVLALERDIAAAIVRGDAAYFDRVTTPDFVMIHGDGWTSGGRPALVDDKASLMRRVADKSYAAHDYDVQSVEMHGDVAITYGRYVGNIPSSPPGRQWFAVWYQKVYAKRDGRWLYLSHRTVDGAADGPWLVGDRPTGPSADFNETDISIADLRWMKLDIARVVAVGNWIDHVDLSKVDEVGFADLMPGSGHGPGGYVNVGRIDVYGKPVKR